MNAVFLRTRFDTLHPRKGLGSAATAEREKCTAECTKNGSWIAMGGGNYYNGIG
jgi:hypothetical protein